MAARRNVLRYLRIIGFYAIQNELEEIVELYQDLGETLDDYLYSREEEDWDDLSDVVIEILEAGSEQIAADRGLREVSAFVQMVDNIGDRGLSRRLRHDMRDLLVDELELALQQQMQQQLPPPRALPPRRALPPSRPLPPSRRVPGGRALPPSRALPRSRALPPPRPIPSARMVPAGKRQLRRGKRQRRPARPTRRVAPRAITFAALPRAIRQQLSGARAPLRIIQELRRMKGFKALPGLYRNTSVGHVILEQDPVTKNYGIFISKQQ